MIRTVENKGRATGYRTKFSNDQLVMIDGIVIQHIVLLKLARVIAKIVIDCIFSDSNSRSRNRCIQINRLIIIASRVKLFNWNSFSLLISNHFSIRQLFQFKQCTFSSNHSPNHSFS